MLNNVKSILLSLNEDSFFCIIKLEYYRVGDNMSSSKMIHVKSDGINDVITQ